MCRLYRDRCVCGALTPSRFEYCLCGFAARELQRQGRPALIHTPALCINREMKLCQTCHERSSGTPRSQRQSANPCEQSSHIPVQASRPQPEKAWTNPHQYFPGLGIKNLPAKTPVALAKNTPKSKGVVGSTADRSEWSPQLSQSQLLARRASSQTARAQIQPQMEKTVGSTNSSLSDLEAGFSALNIGGRTKWAEAEELIFSKPPGLLTSVPAPILEAISQTIVVPTIEDDREYREEGSLRTASSYTGSSTNSAPPQCEHMKLQGKRLECCENGGPEDVGTEWELIRPGDVPVADAVLERLKREVSEEWEIVPGRDEGVET